MNYADNPAFKKALEEFCATWKINHGVLLIPGLEDEISLLVINMSRENAAKLIAAVSEGLPVTQTKRHLNS